jgi:DNA-directed RNA polymerase subunit H
MVKDTDSNFNILEHKLVPEHTILSAEEVRELVEKLNIKISQFPKIFSTDAAVKAIEGEIGDVIKISRASPTAGNTVYYRTVVKKVIKK